MGAARIVDTAQTNAHAQTQTQGQRQGPQTQALKDKRRNDVELKESWPVLESVNDGESESENESENENEIESE